MFWKRLSLALMFAVLLNELSPVPLLATSSVSSQSGEGDGPGQAGSIDATLQMAESKTYRYFLPVVTWSSPPRNLRQTRALWSWAGTRATSKRDIDELVAKVDDAHLGVILLQVYKKGTVYFEPSRTRFPDSDDRLTNQSPFTEGGYSDALSYLLDIRDERRSDDDPFNDFEVHAWFAVMVGGDWRGDQGWPRPDNTKPYMLHDLHPEFKIEYACYYSQRNRDCINHKYSVVHQPRFRAYMVDLIAGLVEDYDVDGVHLDYIRAMGICYNDEPLDYPGTEYDYPGCQEDYKAWTRETFGREYTLWQDTDGAGEIQDGGSGRIAAWQERGVGMLVKQIHDEVKSVQPDVIISAAAGATSPLTRDQSVQGQPAWEWLDQDWIDAAFVMAYYGDTQAVIDKNQQFMDAVQEESKRLKVYPGLATHDVLNPDEWWSDLIIEQINATMYGQWTGPLLDPAPGGVALFVGERLSEEAIQALANGPFRRPALPVWSESTPLYLRAIPRDSAIHMNWFTFEDPARASYSITYTYGTGGHDASQGLSPVQGILSTTQAYSLTAVANYVFYTVTVATRDENDAELAVSSSVRVMPTDIFVYLPLMMK